MAMEELDSTVPKVGELEAGSPESGKQEGNNEPIRHGKLSTFQAYVNLVTVVIGAGIMALPQLPLEGGWVPSSLILLLVVFSSAESGLHMWKAFMASRGKVSISTYDDLGREAWGHWGQMLTAVVTNFLLFGIYSAYTVLIGMQLEDLSDKALDKRIWILLMYPLFVGLALVRDLSSLSKLVPLGMLSACTMAVVIICKSVSDARHWREWDPPDHQHLHSAWPQGSLMSLGTVLATCIGAMTYQAVVPAVLQEMKQPEQFPRALYAANLTSGALYLAVMLAGYYGYGAFINQDIVESMTYSPANLDEAFSGMKASQWTGEKSFWVPPVVSSLVLINIVLSMPLIMMGVFHSIQSSQAFASHIKPGSWANRFMRVTLVTSTIIIALCVPRFTFVFGFFCALGAPAVCLAFPLLFSGVVLRRCGVAQSWWRQGLHGCILILGLVCMVAGVFSSVTDLE